MRRAAMLLAVLVLVAGCAQRTPNVDQAQFRVLTADGVGLALHHFAPTVPDPSTRPVLICPGICSNRYSFLSDADNNIVAALTRSGRDVWVLELRGHGASDKPGRPRSMHFDWDMDDYAQGDLPAAIEFVLQQTGADGLDYVGHSMGGMVAYIALARGGLERVHSLVIVASPVYFGHGSRWISLLFSSERLLTHLNKLPARLGAKLGVLLPPRIDFVGQTLYYPPNVTRATRNALLLHGVDDLGMVEARQWLKIAQGDGLTDAAGALDYLAQLSEVDVPALVLAGSADETASPHQVRLGFEALGSEDKTYVLVGRANGASTDYGHMDLVHGEPAGRDVYPLVVNWLNAHR